MESPQKAKNNHAEVLIAEDSATQAEVLKHLLAENGYAVTVAVNGKLALAMARKNKPSLIISDIVMPEMDGYTLCHEIKSVKELKDIPVVLLTSLSGAEEVLKALQCGADNILRKPYDDKRLLSLIEHSLTNHELRKHGKMQLGLEIDIGGEKHFITSERQQILDLLLSTFMDAVELNRELQAREKDLARSYQSLKGLYGVADALNQATYEQDVLNNALQQVMNFPGVQAGWVSLREGETGFRLAAAYGLPPAMEAPDSFAGDCLCRRKLLAGELDQTTNILECERLQKAKGDTHGLRYHASIPLWIRNRVIGVMNLAGPEQGLFGDEDLQILYSVGNQVAVALERTYLLQQMETRVAERTSELTAEIAEREKAQRKGEQLLQQLTQANRELTDVQERLQLQISRMPIGCIVWDTDFRVQSWNPAAEKIFGYAAEEALGKRSYDLIVPPAVQPHMNVIWNRLLEGDTTAHSVNENTRKDGRRIQCDWSNTPLQKLDGAVIGVLSMVQDVTERQQLELQLFQSQKMEAIGRLAGGVAHDFNNHLGIIIGYSEQMLERLGPDDPLRKSAGMIKEAALRSATLTRQLLAFSRRQVFEPRILDVNAVIIELEKMLRPLIGEDIELNLSLNAVLGKVRVDPAQIDQVIMNLAVNSRDAMPQGGRLTIETADVELDEEYASRHATVRPGSYVMLAVSDTGIGMDNETQTHMFEPFFTTKEKGKGTGLGLATVYGIVKQSGGYIWTYSEPGKGTTFKIYLPRVEAGIHEADAERVSPSILKGEETVLVVEDEGMLRELACELLQSSGYTVLEAGNGSKAIEISRGHRGPIHLLMTDVVMPGMSGRELAQRLHDDRRDMKVLYVSGYTDDSVLRNGLLEPGTAFLQKPFTRDSLARKVREMLDRGSEIWDKS